jgi:hypothetical protein
MDTDGTGFACDQHYQIYLDERGSPALNSDSDIMLDGSLCVGYARVLELRKLNGKRRVPRLSVRAAEASCCTAVVLPLVKVANGRWVSDRTVAPPVLVPLLILGRRAVATAGGAGAEGTFSMGAPDVAAGGQELRATTLSSDLFEAGSMRVATKDLMAMKVDELKEELEARGEAMSGSKAWLRRRLHAAIVREYLDGAMTDEGE